MAVDLPTIHYLFSAVASTAKIIEFGLSLHGRRISKKEVADIVAKASAQAAKKFDVLSPATIALNVAITGPVQDAIRKKIERIRDSTIKILNDDAMPEPERGDRLGKTRRDFCIQLQELKKWNGGRLPPDLETEWQQAGCDEFPAY